MTDAIKYPSTSQFRQVVRTIKEMLTFDGIDKDGNIIRKRPDSWLVDYQGTVKIHGTNGSVVFYSKDDFVFQSKERVLSETADNSGFRAFMVRKDMEKLLLQVEQLYTSLYSKPLEFPVEIAGEWAGRGIQKGVAVSEVEPFFTIFRIAVGKDEYNSMNWLPPSLFATVADRYARIFNVADFGIKDITIDFEFPEMSQNTLVDLTMKAEQECPVGKYFGVSGVGEGYVWTPRDETYASNSGTWFKVKGEKHSVSKVKTLAEVDPERLAGIQEFVAYAVTENRLEQGIQEVGLDFKKVGEYIGWVSRDINKEEGDVLEANSLTMKDVAKFISNKSRGHYLQKLQNVKE